MQMQFSWRTITPGNIPLASHHRVIRTSRILNVFPSFQILTFFNLIPRHETVENGTFCQRFHRISIWRVVTTFTIFTFLALLLLHDIIYFFMDKAFWTSYMQSDNRIVTLLVSVRYILIFIKNCTAVFVFALKSRNMSIYLTRMNALVAKLRITRRQEKVNRILFVILYLIPFLLIGLRVFISAIVIAKSSYAYRTVPFGLLQAPVWARYTFYFFAEFLGGVLSFAVYIQISAFARVLWLFCRIFNKQIIALREKLSHDNTKKGHQINRVQFLNDVLKIRCLHEDIIEACSDHEQLFSFQILLGILTNACIVFSTLASFFTPSLSTEACCVYVLSILGFLYIMFLLPLFPIQLNEESGCTLEFLQTLAHKRHMMRAEQLSSTSHNPSDAVDNMEIISLAAFLQRAYTKPLTISAGGFMDLTRSFVISVGAVIIGFTIFLMERVESQVDLSTGTGTLCHNSSRPFMRVIREIRPVII
ncbi:uncharacterized protein LOC129591350 isoform X1 [Paramacrobiotus metropolitanus]|uniref:uncharacterized protein LOC129591350 isoform X1 n=1 Tax=Paramacrobiotus metropolitanus TaxID=2943436 RepID=UPI0024461463|nr:uncharacterized protein LOC129591350 isoform X1 [Paramacrobiotus metropolitanus]